MLNGIGQTLPNPELLLRPLIDREAWRSSTLEGTALMATPEDLLLYEQSPREPASEADPVNEFREVANYGTALREGMQLLGERPLSTVLIKTLHRVLLTGVRGKDKRPGEFRPDQVQIGSGPRYVPPPAQHVDVLMDNLQTYMNTHSEDDPLVACFVTHYQFEAIHPFLDGNGRVGRALLSLMIQQQLGHTMPWLYLSAYFERYRDEYVDNMLRISTHGDWESWIAFCIRGVIEQADDAIARCNALSALQDEYKARLEVNKARVFRIVELLFGGPAITTSDLAGILGVQFNTASRDIDYLVERGILAHIPGSANPKVYYAPEIARIAFSDVPPSTSPN
jgi:Fic family protein